MALFALLVLIIIISLSKLFLFVESLSESKNKELGISKDYFWDGESTINLVVKNNPIYVLSFDPGQQKVMILSIPEDTYLELPRGFGFWRVSSIFDLGQGEKPPMGAQLLKESVAKLLGLPIDGYIDFETDREVKEIVLDWQKSPLAGVSSYKLMKTDLTPFEILNLYWSVSKVRADKILSLDLQQSNITKSKLLSDSSRVLGVDFVNLDLFIRENMIDSKLVQEGKTVAVFNATDHYGLAAEISRMITNMGADLIMTKTSKQKLEQSKVVGERKSLTKNRISQIYAPNCLKTSCTSEDPEIQNSRAEINIILGEDFYQKLYNKKN